MAPVLLDSGLTDRTGDVVATVEVKLEANGRVLLPADVRRKLGIQPGDTLLLDVNDGGILLWTREMAARGLKDLVSRSVPAETSLVELHAKRIRGESRDFKDVITPQREAVTLVEHTRGAILERHWSSL